MTHNEAKKKVGDIWYGRGAAVLRRKDVRNRCELRYYRKKGGYDVVGTGSSWEEAFTEALIIKCKIRNIDCIDAIVASVIK